MFALLAVLLACLSCPSAHADALRRDFYVNLLAAEDGLAQNTVGALLQDRNGLIWIGTASGLQSYDGYRLTGYLDAVDDLPERPTGMVSALAEDDQGRIWIGSRRDGLFRHDPASGDFSRLPALANTDGEACDVLALWFEAGRGMWVGCNDGLALLNVQSAQVLEFHAPPPEDAAGFSQLRLHRSADGRMWAAARNGLYRVAPATGQLQKLAEDALPSATCLLETAGPEMLVGSADGLWRVHASGRAEPLWRAASGSAAITALARDGHGQVWMALQGDGLLALDLETGRTRRLHSMAHVPGTLPDASITTMLVDRSGLLWLGTYERGLARFDPAGTPFSYVLDAGPDGVRTASNYVRAVAAADDALWVASGDGALKRYRPGEPGFAVVRDPLLTVGPSQATLQVNALAADAGGTLWLGSDAGLARYEAPADRLTWFGTDAGSAAVLAGANVTALLPAGVDGLWIGTARHGLVHLDPATHAWRTYRDDDGHGAPREPRIWALARAADGGLWIGASDGLGLLDPASGARRTFGDDPADPHSLPVRQVRALHVDAAGTLWVGTQAGLARLDAIDEHGARFTRWTEREGLAGSTIYAITSDGAGTLWLSSNRGITRFEPAANSFHSFTMADGLQGMEFNSGAVANLADGSLAFGGVNGLNLITPQSLSPSRFPAPLVLTAAHAGKRPVRLPLPAEGLQMDASDGVVGFEFAALDYTAPERNRFAFRLAGFDRDWIDAGTRRDATYTNLDPGHYVFEVRASNHDGWWSDQVLRVPLQVVPRWWASLPARIAYALASLAVLAGVGVILQRRRAGERRHHAEIREREDRLRLALWGSGDDFWDWDIRSGQVILTGPAGSPGDPTPPPVSRSIGWLTEHMHPEDRPGFLRELDGYLGDARGKLELVVRLRLEEPDAPWQWILLRGRLVERDSDGQPLRMCGTGRDITRERQAERERRIAAAVLHSMGEAVAVFDLDFRFLTVNPAFERMTGWRESEVAGEPMSLLHCSAQPDTQHARMLRTVTNQSSWHGELWQRRKDGSEFLGELRISEVRDANNLRSHYVAVITDVTERKRAERELRYLANYDALTGLPNRVQLGERIGRAIVRARRSGRKVAVLFLDLDRFKHVNDSMGHATGDRMLRAAGERLRGIVRGNDAVFRLGGDEFTVLLEDLAEIAEAEAAAEQVIAGFEQPLELDNGQEVLISPSIGISIYPDHGQIPTDLLKFADTAMYQAKEAGRKTWKIYTEAMDAAARLRATTIAALRKALERNELSLVYQPRMSLDDPRIVGVEALLRWHSQELGQVSPAIFIPVAEETGLIHEIGQWVLSEACGQLAAWRREGLSGLTMGINISVAQLLRGSLVQSLWEVLSVHDLPPHLLELELTESMVMGNVEQSIAMLQRLKRLGVSLAIDDFGTGYSSLSYLRRLPIDTLKIDKEFVGDITTDPDDEAITATIITMGHSLGLNVVAEGVETLEQAEYLREKDCDEIQGHWLSWPLPARECLAFIRDHARRHSHDTATG